MVVTALRATIVALVMAGAAAAQVPAGGEFRVNTQTLNAQRDASAAAGPRGDFVVVWSHRTTNSYYDIAGQRYDPAGTPLGGEFRVNTYTTGFQIGSQVGFDARGNFIVAWKSNYPQNDVIAQRFDASGSPRGGELSLGGPGASAPALAVDPSGSFVVAWSGPGYTDPFDIIAQRVDSNGNWLGVPFIVNTYVTGSQRDAQVSAGFLGEFMVAWTSNDGDQEGVFAQRFDDDGVALGAEFRVNTVTAGPQSAPSISADASGRYVVVWESSGQDGDATAIVGQRLERWGAPIGSEFVVNAYTTGFQRFPVVEAAEPGTFVVSWLSDHDGSIGGVFAQRFTADGTPRGTEFQVNTYTTSQQRVDAIAVDPAGNFTVAWTSYGQDGSDRGIFAQRFGGIAPAALAVDTAGNRVLEPGETVDLRPSWRNVNGAAQTFSGELIDFTGPSVATYAITDSTGDYGTVANGATAACADCYGISLSTTPMRPTHWDAFALEAILPDVQGQQKQWVVHVGASFDDVSPAGGFYRFIETLLHRGVTAGCTPREYCPAGSTTREQMAVFVLVAKEGTGYSPPACTTPVFNDVPAWSPFCRWIEELARRAVVSGCGGGNYCPSDAVTREQMAVFVLRTLDGGLNPPPCTIPIYGDVPPSNGFCRWIEELTRRNVVTGCGGGNYCPADPVTREQMGVFISATFGLTLYGP